MSFRHRGKLELKCDLPIVAERNSDLNTSLVKVFGKTNKSFGQAYSFAPALSKEKAKCDISKTDYLCYLGQSEFVGTNCKKYVNIQKALVI